MVEINKQALDRHITGNYGEDQFKSRPPVYKVHVAVPRGKHREQAKSWTLRITRVDNLAITEAEINKVCEVITKGEE